MFGGGGPGGVVAGEDLFQDVDGGGGVDVFGPDHRVRVAVADDLQVQVVRGAAAGRHRVQLLPGFVAGDVAVHGVGGDALGGVHGGRVPQLDLPGDVVGGEPDEPAVVEVLHGQPAVAVDPVDGPAVAVLHPVGGAGAQPAVVAAGDDHVAGAGLVPVGQVDGCCRGAAADVFGAGALVELRGEFAGGGEHQRIQPGVPVGLPGGVQLVGGGGEVADVDPVVVEVEAERFRPALAQGKGGGGFGRVGEAVEFGEPDGAVGGGDVAEDAAGADRRQLLVVADEPDTSAAADDEVDGGVEGDGVGHPGLVDHHQAVGPDRRRPVGQVVVGDGPGEFGEGVGGGVDLVPQLGGRGGGGGEADDVRRRCWSRRGRGRAWRWFCRCRPGRSPAAAGRRRSPSPAPARPGRRRGGRRSRSSPATPHPPLVSGMVRPPVRPAAATRRCSAARTDWGGVQVGAGDGVDARSRRGGGARPGSTTPSDGRARLVDRFPSTSAVSTVGDPLHLVRGELEGPDLAECFGVDVPDLPGRPAGLHRLQHAAGCGAYPLLTAFRNRHTRRVQRAGDHRGDRLVAAENLRRLLPPGRALLGQRAGFVFRVPGLQRGPLRQLDGFDRGGWPSVVGLELGGQLAGAGLDRGPPGRPALVQPGVDADDLPDRPFPRIRVRPLRKPHPEPVGEVGFQSGVVALGGGDGGLEQQPAVDRQPTPVEGLHLVRDRDMGVQIRIPGPAVAVHERRRDQTADVDLPHPLRPGPGVQGVVFDEPQRIRDRGMMGGFDDRRRALVGHRPQGGDRFDGGEGQVVAGDRIGFRPRQFRDRAGDLPRHPPAAGHAQRGRTRPRPRSGSGPAPRRGSPHPPPPRRPCCTG